jgi:hypothetical protein
MSKYDHETNTILFDKNNPSIKGLGELFFQIQSDIIAKVPDVSEQIKNDWKTIEDWLEIKNGKITEEHRTKFGRAFDSYVRKEKSPSAELNECFNFFKKKSSESECSYPREVKSVFDRMLATDEQIRESEDQNGDAKISNKIRILFLTRKHRAIFAATLLWTLFVTYEYNDYSDFTLFGMEILEYGRGYFTNLLYLPSIVLCLTLLYKWVSRGKRD